MRNVMGPIGDFYILVFEASRDVVLTLWTLPKLWFECSIHSFVVLDEFFRAADYSDSPLCLRCVWEERL